ncbi:MAG: DUF2878 domain-containing protein [Desulfuromonas sp.]|nr:MAG: DUF2878 domain-containing protein [Desulfuromonas sp.]
MNDRRMPSPLASKLINISIYQAGWFFCVLGAVWGYPLIGAISALSLCGLHLLLVGSWKSEIRLMLIACLLGVIVDSLQQAIGIFTFKKDPAWPLWLPLWVFVIWAQFATLFHFSLYWLQNRPLLAALFGAIGGPLAYGAGIRLGAATLGPEPALSILSLAVVWSIVTPVLCRISHTIDAREGTYGWFVNRGIN